eukprot:COSAG06_NODE_1719_length_8590_cov_18.960311_13_plen_162_part_00
MSKICGHTCEILGTARFAFLTAAAARRFSAASSSPRCATARTIRPTTAATWATRLQRLLVLSVALVWFYRWHLFVLSVLIAYLGVDGARSAATELPLLLRQGLFLGHLLLCGRATSPRIKTQNEKLPKRKERRAPLPPRPRPRVPPRGAGSEQQPELSTTA